MSGCSVGRPLAEHRGLLPSPPLGLAICLSPSPGLNYPVG